MKSIFFLSALIILSGCNNAHKRADKKPPAKAVIKPEAKTVKKIQYTEQQLEAYLDSVGKLLTQPLADKASRGTDSILKDQTQLDTVISPGDFEIIKQVSRKGVMRVKDARRIFNNRHISFDCNVKSVITKYNKGLIPVIFYPLDKKHFSEFAICIGDPGHCDDTYLYFFKGNKIIAKHNVYNRYGLELEHYTDVDGKTVVYYRMEFQRGSGIWWQHFFFYKIDDEKVIPILNELQEGNMQGLWGFRVLTLEALVQKTDPLTIKMVYNVCFVDENSKDNDYGPDMINDSTVIKYTWDEQSKVLRGQYDKSKISKPQILSYYLLENDPLFINSYYPILKTALHDKAKRKLLLVYLNNVKNYYGKR